jgi:hypothetical protein
VISFFDFLSFPSSPNPPLYTPCVLRVAPLCAFLIYSSDLSKKKKKYSVGLLFYACIGLASIKTKNYLGPLSKKRSALSLLFVLSALVAALVGVAC